MVDKVKDLIYAATMVTDHIPGVTGDVSPPRPNVMIGVPEGDLYLLRTTVGRLADD